MLMEQKRYVRRCSSMALALCLVSLWATTLSDSQDTRPADHGLMFEKNPGEASSAMIAFFGRPKVELPEAQNVSEPMWRPTARQLPTGTVRNSGHSMPALLIGGIVFAVLGVGLLAAAAVAYMLRSCRASKTWASSSSLVSLTHWKGDSEVQLGASV